MMELFQVVKKSTGQVDAVTDSKRLAKALRDSFNESEGREAFKVSWGKEHWRRKSKGYHLPYGGSGD